MAAASAAARQAVFAPLDGGDRVEAVIDRLSGALTLGLIADGEQLPGETELASALGVATVTLREALSQLRSLGMIETRRGRGGGSFASRARGLGEARLRKRLKNLGAYELRDLGDLQVAVGGMSAMRAADRADEQQLRHLTELQGAFKQATSQAERRQFDGRFHVELAAAAQSRRLTMIEIGLQAEQAELLWLDAPNGAEQNDAFHRQVVQDHAAILKAIRAGDAHQARVVLERHIEDGVERLLDMHFLLNES